MPSLTREEAATLGRRAQQPTRAPGELLAIFVAGALSNPMNATWGHWKRRRWAATWKQRVADVLLDVRTTARTWVIVPDGPKRVAFLAHVHNRFDGDGLQAALKPVRDALVECGVISGDADRDGHEFVYSQVIDRARRGVEVRVSPRKDGA